MRSAFMKGYMCKTAGQAERRLYADLVANKPGAEAALRRLQGLQDYTYTPRTVDGSPATSPLEIRRLIANLPDNLEIGTLRKRQDLPHWKGGSVEWGDLPQWQRDYIQRKNKADEPNKRRSRWGGAQKIEKHPGLNRWDRLSELYRRFYPDAVIGKRLDKIPVEANPSFTMAGQLSSGAVEPPKGNYPAVGSYLWKGPTEARVPLNPPSNVESFYSFYPDVATGYSTARSKEGGRYVVGLPLADMSPETAEAATRRATPHTGALSKARETGGHQGRIGTGSWGSRPMYETVLSGKELSGAPREMYRVSPTEGGYNFNRLTALPAPSETSVPYTEQQFNEAYARFKDKRKAGLSQGYLTTAVKGPEGWESRPEWYENPESGFVKWSPPKQSYPKDSTSAERFVEKLPAKMTTPGEPAKTAPTQSWWQRVKSNMPQVWNRAMATGSAGQQSMAGPVVGVVGGALGAAGWAPQNSNPWMAGSGGGSGSAGAKMMPMD